MEHVFNFEQPSEPGELSSRELASFETAREYIAVATEANIQDIAPDDVAYFYSIEGFAEWPSEIAADVRRVLLVSYGYVKL